MAKTTINTPDIRDSAVSTAKIANDAVDGDKLGITTTKGDLIVHDTSGKPVRLPAGANGKVLVADDTADPGVKWDTPSGAVTFVDGEAPSGSIDGANAAFTLASAPVAGSVRVFKNGIRQNAGAGNDYTVSGSTITFEAGNVPQVGDVVLVDYRR